MIFTSYTVPPDVSRVRADKMLALAFPEHSRVALQRAFDVGLVLIGDNTIKRGHSVNSGDVLRFTLPEVKSTDLTPACHLGRQAHDRFEQGLRYGGASRGSDGR
jgi:ribosomal 50S subunit-recycling heat shock protein